MFKGKLKLSEKAMQAIHYLLGSLIDVFENKEEEVCSREEEELKTFPLKQLEPNEEEEEPQQLESELAFRSILVKDISKPTCGSRHDDVDEKLSELEFLLSQKIINLEHLQRIASCGLPNGGGLRSLTWKLLLGYLPASQNLWEGVLAVNRSRYKTLRDELILNPDVEIAEQIDRDLQRTHPGMKFFVGNSSFSRRTQHAMRNILLLFAKLNPAIRYVQGMNEILAPLYYVFATDPDENNASNAEPDSFSCFVRLLSHSVDHFCQQLDNSSGGIHSTLSHLAELLKANDKELWWHLELSNKVNPQFYAFRWITLLLTQEFSFNSILRIWDSLLSNPSGVQEMLLRVCCAMILCVKSRLLEGDFNANLYLLQHYPEMDIDYLLQVAQQLSPTPSS